MSYILALGVLDRYTSLQDMVCKEPRIMCLIWDKTQNIRNVNSIRKTLSDDSAATIIHALITSQLDNGNALLYDINDNLLRVRAVFHKTVWVCHVYCNFKISFTCRITVIFGTLKDGSLFINTLASNICFSYRNMFQNGVDPLSKIVDAFLSKSSKFYLVQIIW